MANIARVMGNVAAHNHQISGFTITCSRPGESSPGLSVAIVPEWKNGVAKIVLTVDTGRKRMARRDRSFMLRLSRAESLALYVFWMWND